MAVDGWAADGTPRLLCVAPPGGSGSGGSGAAAGGVSGFIPNVFLGYPWSQTQPPSPAMPSITPGTADFSLEVWARRKLGNYIDDQFYSGILEDSSGLPVEMAVIRWNSDGTVSAFFDALGAGAPGAIVITTTLEPSRWSHYVVNFDRNANMELFIDAASQSTASIAAQADSVTGEVHALTASHIDPFHIANFANTLDDIPIFPVIVGPLSIHNRLMTNAEIQDSFRNKKVQNLTGTFIRFDWRKVEGQTGWDTNWSNMMIGHKFGLPVAAGAPQGAATTVSVRDQSGSGNHWTIPSVADYTTYDAPSSTIEDGLWPMPFGADPFFG